MKRSIFVRFGEISSLDNIDDKIQRLIGQEMHYVTYLEKTE